MSSSDLDQSNRLTDFAERIRLADQAMKAAVKEMGARAIEAGGLLIQAKSECPHGTWLDFLEKAGLKERHAQRLMAIVKAGIISDTVSDMGMRGALALAAQRSVPPSGTVLLAWIGNQPESDAAYVFEAKGRPGFWHIAGMKDHDKGGLASWTKKPFPRSERTVIFVTVDMILDYRQSEMSFQVIDSPAEALSIPSFLRDVFIEDAAT